MISGWREVKLDELAEVKGGKRLPKGKLLTTSKTKHPYIRITDFDGFKINLNNIQYVEEDVQPSIARYIVNSGDIILSNVGTLGLSAIVPPELDNANLTENCVKIILNKSEVNNKFLYYQLISPEMQDLIVGLDVGSTQPKLPMYNIKNMDIVLPPLEEQKAIAEVLSSLDDKIDLLHRQNKTLEELVQTLFRQRFIEEAKDEWEVRFFSDLVDVSSGKSLKREFFDDNGKYKVLGANGEIGKTNNWLFDEKLIFTGRVGTLGNIFINNVKAWLSDNTLVIQPKQYFYYIYFLLKSFKLENYNVGSTQPLIRQSDLKNIEISIPSKDIISAFEKKSDDIFGKINKNQNQIKTLENMRDTLLPKLMSGEVKIKLGDSND